MRIPIVILLSVLIGAAPAVRTAESGISARFVDIVVSAGNYDRVNTVVSFQLPTEATGTAYWLTDDSGSAPEVQVDSEGRAWFLLNSLKAGTNQTYRLEPIKGAAPDSRNSVQLTRDGEGVWLAVQDRKVLRYQAEKSKLPSPDIKPIFSRGGYIHPVLSPAGRMVSDDYPPKHVHHHGIWSAWTETEFEGRTPDFWNMGEGTGTVEFDSIGGAWGGPVHGGFISRHRFVDLSAPKPRIVLNETWEVRVYGVSGAARQYWMFDLVSTHLCATPSPLILPEYRYGGIGFRGAREWDGEENTVFLTSEGKTRKDGHATRARWCHIGGKVGGELTGITIMCHPDNFRAPQPMRIHPTEPFFNFAPSQMGKWEITPGIPYVSRYRYIVYDGEPVTGELERLWNDYAYPPDVSIRKK